MITASLEMSLKLVAISGGELVIALDGVEIARVRWLPDDEQFQGTTADGWRTGYRDDAATILADLFGPIAPSVLDRIRTIEEQACALRTFEAQAPLRPRSEPEADAQPEEQPEPDTGPKKLPSLPQFGAMPPK